jgi:hypothetical protein
LRIDYTDDGQSYSAVAYDGEGACVAESSVANDPSCRAFISKSNTILMKMAGLS